MLPVLSHSDIRNIVLKTSGFVDILRQALVKKPGIRSAFVFGSLASGGEKPASDVDVMIVGSVSLRQLSKWLSGAAGRIGREINPHVFTPQEFARRRQERDQSQPGNGDDRAHVEQDKGVRPLSVEGLPVSGQRDFEKPGVQVMARRELSQRRDGPFDPAPFFSMPHLKRGLRASGSPKAKSTG